MIKRVLTLALAAALAVPAFAQDEAPASVVEKFKTMYPKTTFKEIRKSQVSGLYEVVMGENIGQTYQFVATGNAEIGFVALSQVTRDNKITSGSAWVVPEKLYPPIKQDAVLLVNGKDSPAARLLMTFLRSEDTLNVIKSYGYGVK